MTQVLGSEHASDFVSLAPSSDSRAARRWAWMLGFALPLTGLSLSVWIPGYPDRLTLVRLVTFASLMWLLVNRRPLTLPIPSRRMTQAFSAVLVYAVISLLWAPDQAYGINALLGVALALATGVAVMLLVGDDRQALASLVAGLLVALGLQVIIAIFEIRTGFHFTNQFGASSVNEYGLANIEALVGSVAWGTLGNPNDLGGYFLLSIAVFASARAYGVVLTRLRRLLMWAVVSTAVVVGLTALADARAFRLGVAIVLGLQILDRLMPASVRLRTSLILMILACAGVAYPLWGSGSGIGAILGASRSDAIRLTLISNGLSDSLRTGGLGLGIGAEEALIESGQLPTNFHNVAVELAAELGLIVAGLYLIYLVGLVISWAFVTRSALEIGREAAFARATLATSLLIYGFTSSGVLESPHFWAFFSMTVLFASTRRSGAVGLSEPMSSIGHPSVLRSVP